MTDEVMVARAALHLWEEPCVSGKRGAGAVFFSGCPLKCVFCQNDVISREGKGRKISVRGLSDVYLSLEKKGAETLDLVSPTPFVPQVIESVGMARAEGLHIPVVYNTGSYETKETIRALEGTADVFLPDLKFRDSGLSEKMCGAADYFKVAISAIDEMLSLAGRPVFDGNGILVKGVLIRHLVLPGHTKDSKAVLDAVYERYKDDVIVSIMRQYTPTPRGAAAFPELGPKVTKREYERVVSHAVSLGMDRVYIQEGSSAKESYIPAFDGEGVPWGDLYE